MYIKERKYYVMRRTKGEGLRSKDEGLRFEVIIAL